MDDSVKWLRASGLAEALGCESWAVLGELIQRDLEQHPSAPGDIKVSLMDLSRAVGLSTVRLKSIMGKLKKGKYIGAFVPDNDLEECIVRIADPIPCPVAPVEVRKRTGIGGRWRYTGETGNGGSGESGNGRTPTDTDKLVCKIAQMASEARAGAINSIILDRIRDLVQRFDGERIERALAGSDRWVGGSTGSPQGFRVWRLEKELMAREGKELTTKTTKDTKKRRGRNGW